MAKPTPQEIQSYLEAIMSGTVDSPSYDPGFQDYQDDYIASTKAGTSLFADQAYNIANQTVDPGVYAPLTSFEPVEMPGRAKLNQWSAGNAFQRLVSGMLLSGQANTGSIISELARMVAKPENDTEKEIVALLPPAFRYDDLTGAQSQAGIDFQGIRDEVQSLESAMNSDPQNTVIDPNTGLPSTVTMEDSPYTKKLRSLGFTTTPGQQYTGYDFAPQGVTAASDQELQTLNGGDQLTNAMFTALRGNDQDRIGKLKDAYERVLANPPAVPSPAQAGDTRDWSGQSPATQAWWLAQDAGKTLGGINATLPTQPGELEMANTALDWGGKIFLKPGQESPQLPRGIPVPDVVGRHASAFEGTPTEIAMKGIAAGGGALFNAAKSLFGGGGGGGGGSPKVVQRNPISSPTPPGGFKVNGGAVGPTRVDPFANPAVKAAAQKLHAAQAAQAREYAVHGARGMQRLANGGIGLGNEAFEARRQAMMRQAIADQYTQQGRTPFGDDVQRRMAGIYGLNP